MNQNYRVYMCQHCGKVAKVSTSFAKTDWYITCSNCHKKTRAQWNSLMLRDRPKIGMTWSEVKAIHDRTY